MKGWFDAFRHDGGPTLYDRANRTAVTGDYSTITFCVIFITLFVAFLIILPGIRKERFTTFTSVTISLFVGAVILVSSNGCGWHTAEEQIISSYRAFSSEKIVARLGIHIGFNHVNVTLRSSGVFNMSDRIDYNERFGWKGPDDMVEGYEAALRKGLPYPILTVAEYLSLNDEGFGWGRTYRKAGYYSCIALWAAFAAWLLMNIMLVTVPVYGGYMMLCTGGLMLLTNLLYYMNIPSRPLVIRFEDSIISFSFGWSFWLVLAAGLVVSIFGLVITLVEIAFPHKFSTVIELDYDTPYDRHIIIEESRDTKVGKRRSRFEEPISNFGSRIFRRFSKRLNGGMDGPNNDTKFGLDNPSMELDPPKSPWRYPHRTFSNGPTRPTSRSESRKSTKSVGFRDVNVYGNTLHPSSAALGPSLDTSEVETIPDVHMTPEPPIIKTSIAEPAWESDPSSSSEDEGEEIERVQNIPITTINFRTSASRQNSHESRFSRNSSLRQSQRDALEDWDEPERPERTSIVSIIKSALHMGPSSASGSAPSTSTTGSSGASTPMRRISNEEADAIHLDRTGSYMQRSALATVSAKISAAAEADRSRHSSNDDVHRVDLW
ncbi:uncharacterized protein LOC130686459 [Daphnia carinata]|uniref:uncharacterized protein LOC130686459 n=1 Tax=Daphnia carinata TaxID=120202 RepID=UPI00257AB202|nr:uncharacterized protein LOC130686459 [Daphnia carinata]XP_057365579.1 uncharacterized protein LOC130686459 [Daphnia carinata]